MSAVVCDIEVTAPRPDGRPGWAGLRCRHELRGGQVAASAWAGGGVEVTTYDVADWQAQLARVATVRVPTDARSSPAERVDVPLDVLLGAGEALRTGRPDILDELLRRWAVDDATGLREQLVRLHTSVVGRLLVTVACRTVGTPRMGVVSWLLYGDGWRSLTPVRREGRPMVLLRPASPRDLGAEVARLVTTVRGRT